MTGLQSHDLARVLLQVVAILGLARALAPLARRLGQPTVVAEIVAGILLGPSLFGWIVPEAGAWLRPASSIGGLRLLSQLGLMLFMFLVGLELDPRLLRGRAHIPPLVGIASVAIPFGVGLALARWLYPSHGEGAAFGLFSIFLATATSITAFPVLARILSERHLLGTRVGAIAIACAAVDDVVAWTIVTWLVAAARADDWAPAIAALVVVAAVGVAVHMRPVVLRGVARLERRGVRPDAVGAVVFMLLLVCAASELLGVHALFAAFLFGAILPKEGALSTLLVDKLEPLTVSLLLPVFFAYSGLRTELVLIDQPADWAATAVMVVATSGAKIGGSALVARLTGVPWRESAAVGILLNTRGLIGLIVANVGLDLGIVSPTLFAMLVVTALVTTMMTGPLLRRVYPDERIIDERFAEPAPPAGAAPTPPAPAPDVVLACVSSGAAGSGLAVAAHALAGERDASRVFGLHLARPTYRASTELRRDDEDEPEPLAEFLHRARALALPARPLAFVSDAPADDIVRIAATKRASIVLLGAHDPWWLAGRLDGVVGDVIERASATVCVLVGADRPMPTDGLRRMLVAYARTDDGAVLDVARRLMVRASARVTILDIAEPERTNDERPTAPSGCEVVTVEQRSPYQALVSAVGAARYDLVVVSDARRWRVSGLGLGRARSTLADSIQAPLLVVHQGHGRPASQEISQ